MVRFTPRPGRTRHPGVALCVCATLSAAAAPATFASPVPLDSFGGIGTGDGQLAAGASGVALAPGGQIYVADTGNHRVQAFSPAGAPAARKAAVFLAEVRGSPRSTR